MSRNCVVQPAIQDAARKAIRTQLPDTYGLTIPPLGGMVTLVAARYGCRKTGRT
jgi:hypothetical protein